MQLLLFCVIKLMQIVIIDGFNYTIYKITAFNQRERAFLYSLHSKDSKTYFMNGVSNEAAIPIKVAVERDQAYVFESKLHSHNIQYMYFSKNTTITDREQDSKNDITNTFLNWENITTWVDMNVLKRNILKKIVIAKTHEKRDIFILKISNEDRKPIVFITGGEDGKDWISSAIILNFMNMLLKDIDKDKNLLKHFDFYLLPILNPDGFVYSHTMNRLWSKNRRVWFPPVTCQDIIAFGVNIDRNWFFRKASRFIQDECKSVFVGHEPLSEEESQTLSYVLNGLATHMIAFINVRGFGNMITIPYAYKEPSNNNDIIVEIISSAATTLKETYGTTCYVDTTNHLIYNFSGNMADWVKKRLNIPLVYTHYLDQENHFIPESFHISTLTQHFFSILNETLLITKDIYGPLYSKGPSGCQINITLSSIFFIVQGFCKM